MTINNSIKIGLHFYNKVHPEVHEIIQIENKVYCDLWTYILLYHVHIHNFHG